MVNTGEPAPGGQHGLGPHVVGVRVVIRRILPGETGPTGGPAFTDVLGVCERWDSGPDGDAVVRRADGTVLTIPQALIVSGKPVPPRMSRFQKMSRADIDVRLGSAGQSVWLGSVSQLARRLPATDEVDGAGAVLRQDWAVLGGFRGDIAQLAAVVEWAAEQGASTLAITDPATSELLEGLGFVSR